MNSAAAGTVVDFYENTVTTDSVTVMYISQTSPGLTMHKNLLNEQRAKNGIVSLLGFKVFAYPGSAGHVVFTNGIRSISIAVSVRLCLPGEYTDAATKTCKHCSKGTYSDKINVTACTDCEIGTHTNVFGSINCEKCELGKYGKAKGLAVCELCETGRFAEHYNSSSCDPCKAGTFASGSGTIVCKDCPSGTYSPIAATYCENCEVGKASARLGAEACAFCNIGTYMDERGKSQCKDCQRGKYGLVKENVPQCENCPGGKYMDIPAQGECKMCIEGTYNYKYGAKNCTVCEAGKVSSNKGALQCSICPRGKRSNIDNPRFCEPCAYGSVQPLDGKDYCTKCGKGKFSKDVGNPVGCTACETGWYNSETGAIQCKPVPPGYRSDGNLSQIYPCPPGYISEGMTTLCVPVGPGYFQPYFNASISIECPPGSFSADAGSSACTDCPKGTYIGTTKGKVCKPSTLGFVANAERAATGQIRCDFGTFSEGRQAECKSCNPGWFSYSGSAYCTSCNPGKFAEKPKSSSCKLCAKGRWSKHMNSTSCYDCPPGKYGTGFEKCATCKVGMYSSVFGAEECLPCQKGTFSLLTGAASCIECPAGKYTDAKRSIQCKECDINHYSEQNASIGCEICPVKTWTNQEVGATECTPCKYGEVFPEKATGMCIKCRPESYSFYPGENIPKACHPCPIGASCQGGAAVENRIGYWKSHKHANIMNLCLIQEACLGVRSSMPGHPLNIYALPSGHNLSNICVEGHTGPICNTCIDGYGKSGRKCVLCGDVVLEQGLAFLRVLIMFLLLTMLVKSTMKSSMSKTRKPTTTIMKILLSHVQILVLNSGYGVDWPPLILYLLNGLDIIAYLDALLPIDCAMKGSSYFTRTLSYLLTPFFYIPVGAFVLLVVLGACKKKFKKKEMPGTAVVPVSASLKLMNGEKQEASLEAHRVAVKLERERKNDESSITTLDKFKAILIISLIILYPSLSKRALSLFACRKVYIFDPNTRKDIPNYFLSADTGIKCYTEEHLLWEFALGIPSVILYVLGVPLSAGFALFKQRRKLFNPKLEDIDIRVRSIFGFIFRSYEPDWFWWEIVRILRKTTMIVVALFFRTLGKSNHILLSIGVMALNFAVHQHAMPFRNVDLDHLEKYALVCQFITLYSGLFFNSTEVGEMTGQILSYVILLANVAFMLVCMYNVYKYSGMCKKKKKAVSFKDRIAKNMARIKSKAVVSRLMGDNLIPSLADIRCTYCHREDSRHPLKSCGDCGENLYCGLACQSADWKVGGHSKICHKGRKNDATFMKSVPHTKDSLKVTACEKGNVKTICMYQCKYQCDIR